MKYELSELIRMSNNTKLSETECYHQINRQMKKMLNQMNNFIYQNLVGDLLF